MKKIALIAAIAATMTAGVANAYTVNQEASGLVVPNVIHNAANTNVTAVGLVARTRGTVYWVFFDQNSRHVRDGSFTVTANDQTNFIWNSTTAGIGLDGMRGYLVFTLDPNNDGIVNPGDAIGLMSGNAFQIDIPASDVAFTPTIPLTLNGALGDSTAPVANLAGSDYALPVNLATMTGASIHSARATGVMATNGTEIKRLDMRYFIDNAAGGNDTNIAFWTADELAAPVTYTVDMYNLDQNRASVNFRLPNRNLNFVDVETILGRPAAFVDGFITLQMPTIAAGAPGLRTAAAAECAVPFTVDAAGTAPTANCRGGILSYSVINSPMFGAAQTMLAAHN